MTAGREGSAVTRPDVAPVFAPEGVAVDAATAAAPPPPSILLGDKLRAYDPKADTGLIDAAYTLARDAHGTQTRDNGEPYITHPRRGGRYPGGLSAGYRLDRDGAAA